MLGKFCDDTDVRDAVHVAIVPITATVAVHAGQHVDANGDPGGPKKVGVVDPFLDRLVYPGDKFWLCLYPETVTGMRHHWSHPAFDTPAPTSVAYLTDYASQVDLTYLELLDVCKKYLETGVHHRLNFDTPEFYYKEFWDHFTNVTGVIANDDDYCPFTCAC